MTRAEREQLIERYLEGVLTPAEEQEFFIEVATDREMQYDLKASQVVESAIRKDRNAAPESWSSTRTHLANLLAEQHPASPDTRFSHHRFPGMSGWILAASIALLFSFSALLVSLVAIDRTSDREEVLPVSIEQSSPEPQEVETFRGTEPAITAPVETKEGVREQGQVTSAAKRNESSREEEKNTVSERKGGYPEQAHNIQISPQKPDTTNPDGKLPIDIDTPSNR